MTTLNFKHRARQRRERKFRLWLATLSWTTPVMAFGSMFTIWNHVSENALTPKPHVLNSTQLKKTTLKHTSTSTKSGKTVIATESPVLYSIGSRSQQVLTIQERLFALGYFHHAITTFYGPVTADAVKAFQANHHLPQTGGVDATTMAALVTATNGMSLSRPAPSNSVPSASLKENVPAPTHHSSQSAHVAPPTTRTPAPSSSTQARSSGSASVSQSASQPVVTTGAS